MSDVMTHSENVVDTDWHFDLGWIELRLAEMGLAKIGLGKPCEPSLSEASQMSSTFLKYS